MVVEEILHSTLDNADNYNDLMTILEVKATESKLWVENLIKPVFIMMLFVRAEREADWILHLWAVSRMLPYFFAAGHVNYARYGLYYFMRHNTGLWNGMWSDMFIETTFMRYGHGPGGIIGITLKPSALKCWALSLHICSHLIKDLADMNDAGKGSFCASSLHKDEMPARKISDARDRKKISEKLMTCIDPLNSKDHPENIINIATGQIAPGNVNAHYAVTIGQEQMKKYELAWPEGFHNSLEKQIVTMTAIKKCTKFGSSSSFDTSLIFFRVMCLMNSRNIDVEHLFSYELAPIPTSMFTDNGDMRISKTKSVLKRKLQVEQSSQIYQQSEVSVIDGCAILWVIHWPSNGVVKDFVNGFIKFIFEKLSISNLYLVFDRYYDFSIKSGTRKGRAGSLAARHHKIRLDTPLPSQKVILNVTENNRHHL